MEDLQFSQTGKKWSIEEDQQLITEYTSGNDIVDKLQARGYTTYKNSEYNQNYLISEKEQETIIENNPLTDSKNNNLEISQDISNMKNEVKEIKTSIDELKEILTKFTSLMIVG